MCDDACHINQTSENPGWPKIITYTKGFLGTKRCYELINREGAVKFRTIRWDETKEEGSLLKFPNGMPLWSFRTDHPTRPLIRSRFDPSELDSSKCWDNSTLDHILGTTIMTEAYRGAVMMSGRNNINHECWDLAHGLLATGVVNETCAQYFWQESETESMGIKFVPCKEF
jgi:hypothetical protein